MAMIFFGRLAQFPGSLKGRPAMRPFSSAWKRSARQHGGRGRLSSKRMGGRRSAVKMLGGGVQISVILGMHNRLPYHSLTMNMMGDA